MFAVTVDPIYSGTKLLSIFQKAFEMIRYII